MFNNIKITAIIPAAGSGKRFGAGYNKAFHSLQGKPLLLYVLELFQKSDEIDEIIPVFQEEDREAGLELISRNTITKVKQTAPGGDLRQYSVYNGLKLINDPESIVMVHDGARPFLSERIIKESLMALRGSDGVIPVVPLKDTIKETEKGYVKKTVDREKLRAVQTPQTFYYKRLKDAFEKAFNNNLVFTDEASVVEQNGGQVKTIDGDNHNIKITTMDDIAYADYFLNSVATK